MKGFVLNSWRGSAPLWWLALGLVVLLTACTVDESDAPVRSDDAEETDRPIGSDMEPEPSGQGDWHVPGLVDRSGAPIEVPTPGPATGKTLDVTDFGADPDPDSPDDADSHPGGLGRSRTG